MEEDLTIREARNRMRPDLHKGTVCLCCHQPTKLYHRPLTSSMAYGLMLLYKQFLSHGDSRFIHIESFFKVLYNIPSSVRGDIPKFRFWGLIEPQTIDKEDGNPCNGMYRITASGKAFVENKLTVSSHILLYNNTFYGYPPESKSITIIQALKNKFDYSKIIKKRKSYLKNCLTLMTLCFVSCGPSREENERRATVMLKNNDVSAITSKISPYDRIYQIKIDGCEYIVISNTGVCITHKANCKNNGHAY